MNGNVSEKNVKKLRPLAIRYAQDLAHFVCRKLPRLVADLPEPKPSQKVRRRLRHDVDLVEREFFGVLAFLSNDMWPDAAQTGNLPIDVEHLRL